MEKGHEKLDLVDPDSLDDEAFLEERDKLLSEGGDDRGDEAGQSLDDKDGDTGQEPPKDEDDTGEDGGEPDTPEGEDGEKPDGKAEEKDGEPKPFSLDDGKEEKEGKPRLKIVHDGQEIHLTEEEAVRRAQMGTNYEAKMAQIAPHRRLLELVAKDTRLQGVLKYYLENDGKLPPAEKKPELKSLADYEGDDAVNRWFLDNHKAVMEAQEKPKPPAQPASQPEYNMARQVSMYLSMNDPEHFDQVFPEMARRLPGLTPQDQARINAECAQGDLRSISKYYNYVKDNIVKPGAKPKPANTGNKGEKFRVKPGGGSPPKETSENELPDAFSLSDADFRKQMARLKGHA